MLKKLFNNIVDQKHAQRITELNNKLIRHEAKIGGKVFGTVPNGRKRQFFCLDEHTWVWHEEWVDENHIHNVVTTRYDVRPDIILKSQNGQSYQRVSPKEATKLYEAAKIYQQRVSKELYNSVA